MIRKHWDDRARKPKNCLKYYEYRSARLEKGPEFRERVNEPAYKAETQAKPRAYYQRKKAESKALKDLIP